MHTAALGMVDSVQGVAEGSSVATPAEGMGKATPAEGTGKAMAEEGIGEAMAAEVSGVATPAEGTGVATPADGSGVAAPAILDAKDPKPEDVEPSGGGPSPQGLPLFASASCSPKIRRRRSRDRATWLATKLAVGVAMLFKSCNCSVLPWYE